MSTPQQQHTTAGPADAQSKRGQWTLRIKILSPHFALLPGASSLVDPSTGQACVLSSPVAPADLATRKGIDHAVERALAFVPGLDLGEDEEGLPVIAAEVLLRVSVVDPAGRERVVRGEDGLWWRKVIGWEALEAFDLRERLGEGVIEEGPNEETIDPLKVWVWRERAATNEDEQVPVVILQGAG